MGTVSCILQAGNKVPLGLVQPWFPSSRRLDAGWDALYCKVVEAPPPINNFAYGYASHAKGPHISQQSLGEIQGRHFLENSFQERAPRIGHRIRSSGRNFSRAGATRRRRSFVSPISIRIAVSEILQRRSALQNRVYTGGRFAAKSQ